AHIVDRDEIRRRWPLCRVDDLEGGIWIPHDGRVIPADTTQALAAGARAGGARIVEETAVREVLTRDGAVAGVRTSHGEIACDVVVNCAGMWARELGALNGITVPVFPVEHFYAVTRPIAGVSPDLPVLRDYDGHIYVRAEVGGLQLGWDRVLGRGRPRARGMDRRWPHADGPLVGGPSSLRRVPR